MESNRKSIVITGILLYSLSLSLLQTLVFLVFLHPANRLCYISNTSCSAEGSSATWTSRGWATETQFLSSHSGKPSDSS